jgi:hypothetical protein
MPVVTVGIAIISLDQFRQLNLLSSPTAFGLSQYPQADSPYTTLAPVTLCVSLVGHGPKYARHSPDYAPPRLWNHVKVCAIEFIHPWLHILLDKDLCRNSEAKAERMSHMDYLALVRVTTSSSGKTRQK